MPTIFALKSEHLEEQLAGELADRTGGREGTESKLSHLADLLGPA